MLTVFFLTCQLGSAVLESKFFPYRIRRLYLKRINVLENKQENNKFVSLSNKNSQKICQLYQFPLACFLIIQSYNTFERVRNESLHSVHSAVFFFVWIFHCQNITHKAMCAENKRQFGVFWKLSYAKICKACCQWRFSLEFLFLYSRSLDQTGFCRRT